MISPQDDLKSRLAAVLKDLNDTGRYDARAMWVLGSIATQILAAAKLQTWAALRAAMTDADYAKLVDTFRERGNGFVAEGNHHAAYAVQALALSVVARNQTDPAIAKGASLLDSAIERAIIYFRNNPPTLN